MLSTNALSRFASIVLDSVLEPARLARHAGRCPCIFVVPEAMHEVLRGPLMGIVSAQKSPLRVQANQLFFTRLAPVVYLIACKLPGFVKLSEDSIKSD